MSIFGTAQPNCPGTKCISNNLVHLILYAKGKDVNTFQAAAKTLETDYRKHYQLLEHKIITKSFAHGRDFVDLIDLFEDNSILSLDVISHGNMFGIHVSEKIPPEPAPEHHLYWHPGLRHKVMKQFSGKDPQTVDDAIMMEEKMLGMYKGEDGLEWAACFFNQKKCTTERKPLSPDTILKVKNFFKEYETLKNDDWIGITKMFSLIYIHSPSDSEDCPSGSLNENIRFIKDVNKKKFHREVFIEFHGCRIGEEISVVDYIKDNFAEEFAEHLNGDPTVVAHTENNFPNGHPVNQNDYRRGPVRVYTQNPWLLDQDASREIAKERWELKFKHSSTPPDKPNN
ncbi:MAG: hypothetical protein HC877_15160 [Thioploca sp.]|nr:hypothetical protein [Thioploca sp.]